jgi:hypothetical protein
MVSVVSDLLLYDQSHWKNIMDQDLDTIEITPEDRLKAIAYQFI